MEKEKFKIMHGRYCKHLKSTLSISNSTFQSLNKRHNQNMYAL
jgi:hypothetical protein